MFNGNRFFKLLLALVLGSSLSLAGCGGGGGGGSSSGGSTKTGSMQFINNSTHSLDAVYAYLSSSSSIGSKQNSSAITAGTSWTLSGLAANTYDAEIASYGVTSNYYAFGSSIPITAGATTALIATDSNFSGSLIVTNTTLYPITALSVSSTAFGAGSNLLTSNVVAGATRQIVGIPSGAWYVQAVINGTPYNNMVSIASYSYTTISY